MASGTSGTTTASHQAPLALVPLSHLHPVLLPIATGPPASPPLEAWSEVAKFWFRNQHTGGAAGTHVVGVVIFIVGQLDHTVGALKESRHEPQRSFKDPDPGARAHLTPSGLILDQQQGNRGKGVNWDSTFPISSFSLY